MRPLLLALQFLTRLPVPLRGAPEGRDLGRSVLYYPLVGALLGLLLWGGAGVLHNTSPALAAALLLCGWVLFTGALHLDGLADSADAWAGGHGDRERTLAIMKDPASGPVGVTLLVLVLLLKYAALQAVLANGEPWPLLFAPLLGRTALPLLFLTTPYVRAGGLGEALAGHLPRRAAMLVIAAVILLSITAGITPALMTLAAALTFLALRALMRHRLGGTTGDTAGALVEVTEAVVIAVSAL
jgi:adenosylcobinamide-GDP ribazoletransferase